jgi:hypothetical protein
MFHDVAEIITAAAALGAVLMSWRNSTKIQDVHVSINSRMDQLLAATGLAARANGVAQGRREREERDAAG